MNDTKAIRAYVSFMMKFIARALCAASAVDPIVREELDAFPEGFTFEMGVLPDGPSLRLKKQNGVLGDGDHGKPDLAIRFKHLRHALVSFTFQESVAQSFAAERMVLDGEIPHAMRMQRVLDRLLFLTLPEPIAKKALKRVPTVPVREKATAIARLFGQMLRP
jgi:hypothetical protein